MFYTLTCFSECAAVNSSLPSLVSYPVTCNLDITCNKLLCCVQSSLTNSTFRVSFQMDPCNRTLHLSVENLHGHIPFSEFTWGITL